jgi:hypothetical protein
VRVESDLLRIVSGRSLRDVSGAARRGVGVAPGVTRGWLIEVDGLYAGGGGYDGGGAIPRES